MKKIRTDIPLHVGKIVLKNLREIDDRIVFITDRFLIVAKYSNEGPVTFYNLDSVDRLIGVSPDQTSQPEQKTGGNVWFC